MPSPSIVVTLVALCCTARLRQELIRVPFDDHRAGAALAVVAALLGAGQVQMLAQRVEQRRAGIDVKFCGRPLTRKLRAQLSAQR